MTISSTWVLYMVFYSGTTMIAHLLKMQSLNDDDEFFSSVSTAVTSPTLVFTLSCLLSLALSIYISFPLSLSSHLFVYLITLPFFFLFLSWWSCMFLPFITVWNLLFMISWSKMVVLLGWGPFILPPQTGSPWYLRWESILCCSNVKQMTAFHILSNPFYLVQIVIAYILYTMCT